MNDDRNRSQIIRIDARNCFVESLNDAFEIGKAHFTFASYDLSKPSGQRQTNSIQIYIDMAEVLELCRKLVGGELRYLMQVKKKNGDSTPLYQCLGGTSAEKLARYGRTRADGKSLSRTAQLVCGSKTDFLFVADSGPGETNAKGLIVPRFGKNPDQRHCRHRKRMQCPIAARIHSSEAQPMRFRTFRESIRSKSGIWSEKDYGGKLILSS